MSNANTDRILSALEAAKPETIEDTFSLLTQVDAVMQPPSLSRFLTLIEASGGMDIDYPLAAEFKVCDRYLLALVDQETVDSMSAESGAAIANSGAAV